MNAPCICPACGQSYAGDIDGVTLDMGSNTVSVNGASVRLTSAELDLFAVLLRPGFPLVSNEGIFSLMYGARLDQPQPKILHTLSCKARAKLKKIGLDIQNEWGEGYRLVYPEAA